MEEGEDFQQYLNWEPDENTINTFRPFVAKSMELNESLPAEVK